MERPSGANLPEERNIIDEVPFPGGAYGGGDIYKLIRFLFIE